MSSQPFTSFRQADDFFNVYLHTNDSINTSTQNPRWLINPSSALQDRYKPYKKCIAVVNFVDLPSGTMITTSGNGLVIRDVSSQQMNSSDSKTNQSNIIYFLQAINNTDSNVIKTYKSDDTEVTNTLTPIGSERCNLQKVGFPYEKANPFGIQELTITTTSNTTAINANNWGIHITYYFYIN